MEYKKERSSKQHMKIEVGQNTAQEEVFTLANPMTYGDATTPTSPANQPASRPGGHTVSNPTTPTIAHSTGFSRTFERLSLKTKSKNQSFFKFFGRGHEKTAANPGNGGGMAERIGSVGDRNGGMGDRNGAGSLKRVSMNDEDFGGDGSSGSDHDDAFSPQSSGSSGEMLRANRQLSEPPKSPSGNGEVFASVSRQPRRHNSGGHSSRDSGFSSERESVSHVRITPQTSLNTEDDRVSPTDEGNYQPAGMEALEILHNQLQLLVKRDSDEDTDSVDIYEQIINSLSRQLEEQHSAMDILKQTETNLRLSLRLAEQRALEAETEKAVLKERCVRVERRYFKMSAKYKAVKERGQETGGSMQASSKPSNQEHAYPKSRNSVPQYPPHQYHQPVAANGTCSQVQDRTPPQRVQSQTLFDRRRPMEQCPIPSQRPSTAQGFHNDQGNNRAVCLLPSLSHTETRV